MAKKLDNTKVGMGVLIHVANLKRKPAANEDYYALKVEMLDGKNEHWLLFTQADLVRHKVEIKGITDQMKLGRLYPDGLSLPTTKTCYVRFRDGDTEKTILLTDYHYRLAKARAERNPEDIPSQSFISDLMD